MRTARVAYITCLAIGLGGCLSQGWEYRRGIAPVINPVAVETASSNHMRILTALARDANIVPTRPGDWYLVAEAGFNFIDDECRLYFNHLFFLNREREQLKSGIIAATATTAAILGVTGASQKSMTIVAEAFGIGAVATDLIAGTFLYRLPPATTMGFVKEMQLAHRQGAALRRAAIDSPTAAYHTIQEYLSLCLPPTIEAKISEHISGARAFPDASAPGAGASFGITVTSPPPLSRREVGQAVGLGAGGPVTSRTPSRSRPGENGEQKKRDPTPRFKGAEMIIAGYTPEEFPPSTIIRMQNALCVPSVEVGRVGDTMLHHIAIFESSDMFDAEDNKLITPDGKIDANERDVLVKLASCPRDTVRNFYERVVFSDGNAPNIRARVSRYINRLNRVDVPGASPLANDTRLAATRNRIISVRDELMKRPEMAKKLNSLPNSMRNQWTRDLFDLLSTLLERKQS